MISDISFRKPAEDDKTYNNMHTCCQTCRKSHNSYCTVLFRFTIALGINVANINNCYGWYNAMQNINLIFLVLQLQNKLNDVTIVDSHKKVFAQKRLF